MCFLWISYEKLHWKTVQEATGPGFNKLLLSWREILFIESSKNTAKLTFLKKNYVIRKKQEVCDPPNSSWCETQTADPPPCSKLSHPQAAKCLTSFRLRILNPIFKTDETEHYYCLFKIVHMYVTNSMYVTKCKFFSLYKEHNEKKKFFLLVTVSKLNFDCEGGIFLYSIMSFVAMLKHWHVF